MPVLYYRPDGDQRGVTITLTSHTWGKLGAKPACLLRFQFDIQYGRDQRFMEAALTLNFSASPTSGHANPEITDYGPVHIESNPTSEEHVNKSTGQVAVSVPMVEGVEGSVGAERQSSWTQLHSGKMQGHRGLQKGSKVLDRLSWQMEEDGRAKSGVFKICRAAVVVVSEGDFVVSAEKVSCVLFCSLFLFSCRCRYVCLCICVEGDFSRFRSCPLSLIVAVVVKDRASQT